VDAADYKSSCLVTIGSTVISFSTAVEILQALAALVAIVSGLYTLVLAVKATRKKR